MVAKLQSHVFLVSLGGVLASWVIVCLSLGRHSVSEPMWLTLYGFALFCFAGFLHRHTRLSVKCGLRTIVPVCILAFVLASGCSAKADSFDANLVFQTSDQSMWGPGQAAGFSDTTTLLSGSFSASGSVGGISTVKLCFFGCKASFGAQLTGSASGSASLGFAANLTTGSVNVALPVSVGLGFPDPGTVKPGSAFTITSSVLDEPGATLTTESPQGSASLYADVSLKASLGAKACVFACASGSTGFSFNKQTTLFSVNQSSLNTTVNGPLGLSGSASFPVINTTGSMQSGVLRSSGLAPFLSANENITDAMGLPLNGSVSLGVGTISYNLAKLSLGLALAEQQNFSFDPAVMLNLQLSTGADYVLPAGQSLTLEMPEDGSPLTVTPTFFLDDAFSNSTDLAAQSCLDFSALSASASLFGAHLLNIGPLINKSWCATSPDISVFQDTFRLTGFQTFTEQSFEIRPTPEPASWFFLLTGAALVLALRSRWTSENSPTAENI